MFDLLCGPGVISQDTLPQGRERGLLPRPSGAFSEGSENLFLFRALCGFWRKDFLKAEKAEPRSVAGRRLFSLAVPERTCRTTGGSIQRCQPTSNCNIRMLTIRQG